MTVDVQELRRLAEAAALRQQIFNVEGTMASMAQLNHANNDLSRACDTATILSLLTELATLRETNQRLNRRCQQAESAAAEKVESVRSDLMKTGVRGRPLGRMLANFRCAQLEEELELARKVVAAFEQFEADEQGVFGPHIGTTRLALAEYRAAYPVKP